MTTVIITNTEKYWIIRHTISILMTVGHFLHTMIHWNTCTALTLSQVQNNCYYFKQIENFFLQKLLSRLNFHAFFIRKLLHEYSLFDWIPEIILDDHHHDFIDDHHHFHHPPPLPPPPPPTTTPPPPPLPPPEPEEPEEQPRVKKYSYFYLSRSLWYIPLYFTVWFTFYVTWLILQSIGRHKVHLNSFKYFNCSWNTY